MYIDSGVPLVSGGQKCKDGGVFPFKNVFFEFFTFLGKPSLLAFLAPLKHPKKGSGTPLSIFSYLVDNLQVAQLTD